jgi:hypothetical protein
LYSITCFYIKPKVIPFGGCYLNDEKIKNIIMAKNIVCGYYEESYPPLPTRATKFWRRCILKQIIMFFILNLRIMRIIVGGHS